MTKRAVGWMGALALVLAVALSARQARRIARSVFNRTILAATGAVPDVGKASQPLPPRDPNFLLPQRLDAWQIIGPGGGGTFYQPAISPHDPNLVFATTDMTECYVSENGGHTWRAFNYCMVFPSLWRFPSRSRSELWAAWSMDS